MRAGQANSANKRIPGPAPGSPVVAGVGAVAGLAGPHYRGRVTPITPRKAARAVLVDREGDVLLLCGRDPSSPAATLFWFTPGGGIEPGESAEDAARREAREEVGAQLGALGPVVWHRTVEFVFDGAAYSQHEVFYVVEVDRFQPRPLCPTELEVRSGMRAAWWRLAELERATAPVHPGRLAQLLGDWRRYGPPAQPIRID